MFKEKARCCRALQSRATIKEDVGSKLVHVVKKVVEERQRIEYRKHNEVAIFESQDLHAESNP